MSKSCGLKLTLPNVGKKLQARQTSRPPARLAELVAGLGAEPRLSVPYHRRQAVARQPVGQKAARQPPAPQVALAAAVQVAGLSMPHHHQQAVGRQAVGQQAVRPMI